MAEDARRYRFGPLERRGLVGSLTPRAGRSCSRASLDDGVILMRVAARASGSLLALALVLAALAFCFWPIAGRAAEEWLPVAVDSQLRRARGRHRHLLGRAAGRRQRARRRTLEAGRLAPGGGGRARAARRAAPRRGGRRGQGSPRAHLHRRPRREGHARSAFSTDRSRKRARRRWGGVLASLAREGSPVSRIQWVERTVPADGDEIGRYLGEAWDRGSVPLESLAMQSYLDLVGSAPAVTKDHELFVCLQIDAKRAWRQIKRAGGKHGADAGACAVLLRELEALGERLGAADVRVVGALRPGMLASAIRVAFDPWSRPGLARLAAADRERDGIDEAAAWPVGDGDVLGDVPDRRRRPRDLLDRELAANGRRRRLPLAAAPARPDGARGRGHDRADLAASCDPRGRGVADERPRRRGASRAHGLHGDGAAATDGRGDHAARGRARRRARRRPLRGLRDRLGAIRRGARAPLLRGRARRPDGAARAAPPLRPAGGGASRTRCRSAGDCGEGRTVSPVTGRRRRTSRPPTRSSPRAASAGAASTSAATSTAAPSATTRGSSTAAS